MIRAAVAGVVLLAALASACGSGESQSAEPAASVTSIARIVAEFFTIKAGRSQEVQAVMTTRADQPPTGWDTRWDGPGRGGWSRMPTGQ